MKIRLIVNSAMIASSVMLVLAIAGLAGDPATRGDIIQTAKEYLGTAYRYGDTGNRGFDCSGFTMHVFGKHGIRLERTTTGQFKKGTEITLEEALPGDLVFFIIRRNRISHVGIYLGDRSFIHSPSTGKRVQVSSLDAPYWKTRFAGVVSYFKDSPFQPETENNSPDGVIEQKL